MEANQNKKITEIRASLVTIQVTDEITGRSFSRTLPLDYYENDNGIRLNGEDMQGKPSEIVFLSSKAIEKIHDLTGHGANEDQCGGHGSPN
jgi:hypothetical protein